MTKTTVFKNNTTQAVRLPKDVALPDNVREVEVFSVGVGRLIVPAGKRWDFWFDHGLTVTVDFMADRNEPLAQERGNL